MARVHKHIQQAKELVFIDSSSSFEDYNNPVFVLSTSSAAGGMKCDPSIPGWSDMNRTPLHNAAQNGYLHIVKYLVEDCACDPSCQDTEKVTPLYLSSLSGHLDVVKFLISECNCDANIPGMYGKLPLHCAARSGCLPLVKYLVEEIKCNPQALDNYGHTPIIEAAHSSLPCVQYFVKATNSLALKSISIVGETTLDFAAYCGQIEIIDYLINDCNFRPDATGWMGRALVHCAADNGHIKLLKHLITKYNCNPEAIDDNGDTPLHCVAAQGYLDIVKYLTLELNCDPLPTDNYGNTPLHDAARNGHLEVVRFLIETLHCPSDMRGSCNMTPLEWAFFKKHYVVVQYLKKAMSNFEKAKHTAQVPFLHYACLKVDDSGLEYCANEHEVTIRVFKGAIDPRKLVHLEVAVAMYGPFNFPENMHPISPILWLCFKEVNVELRKPIEVVLPHSLTRLSKEKAANYENFISLAKANHNNFTTDRSGQIYYNFSSQTVDDNIKFEFGAKNYGALQTTHCCFICLQKNIKLSEGTGYSLARIELKSTQSGLSTLQEFHFYATFDLSTCREALVKQLEKKGLHKFNIVYSLFGFEGISSQAESCLRIYTPKDHDSSFMVAMEPENGKIMASKIDYRKFDFIKMKDYHDNYIYPPSLRMEVIVSGSNPTIFPLRFEGCTSDSQLNADLVIKPAIPAPTNLKLQSQPQYLIHKEGYLHIDDLKVVLNSTWEARAKWFDLGVQLDMKPTTLEAIQRNNKDHPDDCMKEMLKDWLKQSNPEPTWSSLVAALKQPTVGLGQLAESIKHEPLKDTSNGSTLAFNSFIAYIHDSHVH